MAARTCGRQRSSPRIIVWTLGVMMLGGCTPDIGRDTAEPMVVAGFDPLQAVVPLPNDLLFDPVTERITVPPEEGDTETTLELKAMLGDLDGFGTYVTPTATFEGALDPTSVTTDSVILLDLDDPGAAPAYQPVYDGPSSSLVVVPAAPLLPGHRYMVAMTSDLKGGAGERVVASQTFYLATSPEPLTKMVGDEVRSITTMLDDEEAVQLEMLRGALSPALDALEQIKGVGRDRVVLAWTFQTQTMIEAMTERRDALEGLAVPTAVAFEASYPMVLPAALVYTAALAAIPHDDIGGVAIGRISWADFRDSATGTLRGDGGATIYDVTEDLEAGILFVMSIPNGDAPAEGWPTVIFAHGLSRGALDLAATANSLAQAGFAAVGIDMVLHGYRSADLTDECDNVVVTFDAMGAIVDCCPEEGVDECPDNYPDRSGEGFISSNAFASRDNARQSVLDFLQLVRVIKADSFATLDPRLKLNAQGMRLFGHSLGAALGVNLLALSPEITTASLAAPAGGFSVILDGTENPTLIGLVEGVLVDVGAERGTADYAEFLATIQWVMDPADPINFARFLTSEPMEGNAAKEIMVLIAGADTVFPRASTDILVSAASLTDDRVQVIEGADHDFLLTSDLQAAAVGFLAGH